MLLSSRDGGADAPIALAERRLLAAGAVVATLVAHRRDWVRRHVETVEVLGSERARHEVAITFELPRIAWAMAPEGTPVRVPLALVPKAAVESLAVEDEAGTRVDVVPARESAEVAAAGLLALAQTAGAEADDLRTLAWRIAAGTHELAERALAELARGDTHATRLAWMHAPFREL